MTRLVRASAVTSIAVASLTLWVMGCSSVSYSEDFDRDVQVRASGTWAWQPLTEAQQESLSEISPFLQRRIERAVSQELDGRGFKLVSDGPADYLLSAYALLPDRSSRPSGSSTLSRFDVRARPPLTVSVGFGVGFGHPYRFGSPYGFGGWGAGFWPVLSYWNPYSWYLGASWGWGRPYFGHRGYGWSPFFGYGMYSLGGYGPRAVIGSGDRSPGTLVIDVLDAASGNVVWQGLAKGALLDMPPAEELDAYMDEIVRRTLAGFPPG